MSSISSPSPQSEPAIVGMSRSAAELVYWLRRSEQDIVNLMAEIDARHSSLRTIINNLNVEEKANFGAELPSLVLQLLELHESYMGDQQKASVTESMASARFIGSDPPSAYDANIGRKVRDNSQA